MSDLIRREDVMRLAESGKLLSGSYGERAKDIIKGIPSAEPKEYVKGGTLTVQMPTIKEAKAIDKIVVYADTYKQEYYKPKVGRNTKAKTPTLFGCSVCGWECWDTVPCDTETFNYCPNCGAKMERSE